MCVCVYVCVYVCVCMCVCVCVIIKNTKTINVIPGIRAATTCAGHDDITANVGHVDSDVGY